AVKICRSFRRPLFSYPLVGLPRPNFGTLLECGHTSALSKREHVRAPEKLFRQAQQSLRALAILSIHEHQSAVVRFSNLTAQWQSNSGAFRFRGKERNEEIGGGHDAGTFLFNKDLDAISFLTPTERDVSVRFNRGINSVVQKID